MRWNAAVVLSLVLELVLLLSFQLWQLSGVSLEAVKVEEAGVCWEQLMVDERLLLQLVELTLPPLLEEEVCGIEAVRQMQLEVLVVEESPS